MFLKVVKTLCTLLLVGCTSNFSALRSGQDEAIHDLRMEVADLKHALGAAETEVKILEERFESAEEVSQKSNHNFDVKNRIAALEKSIDKLTADIRALSNFSTQTTAALNVYREQIAAIDGKLDEVSKLRSTLSQLAKPKLTNVVEKNSYQVKPGDSLEKISRKFQVTIESLKQENKLSSDKIVVGQELAIPSK